MEAAAPCQITARVFQRWPAEMRPRPFRLEISTKAADKAWATLEAGRSDAAEVVLDKRSSFRLKNALNVFIISTQTVPPITLLIPYFGMVVAFGIFDTYFALILTYMVFTLPYAIMLMTGYLNTLPRELDEAVLVDGGSSWTALWRVIVPLSAPGIVATAVYTFLLAWNEFLFALTLTKSMNMRTVPIGIELLMGQHAFEWNEMMAMSVLGSLPLLILYLIAQRYFLAGMTAGSVKS